MSEQYARISPPPGAGTIQVAGEHGEALLTLRPDGQVSASGLVEASLAGRVFVDAMRGYLAEVRREAAAEALQEAIALVPLTPDPGNPFEYDPWADDSVDPSNVDDIVRAAASKGWEKGAYVARDDLRAALEARATAIENGEKQ